jgi:hypothetical protein
MQHYSQLTSEKRYQIYALLKMNHTQTDIVGIVGVHRSTIGERFVVTLAGGAIDQSRPTAWR